MKVLVTGGSGYLGEILTPLLPDAVVLDTVEPMNARVEWVKGSITDADAVRLALDSVEAVAHLAAIVGDVSCDNDPTRAMEVNYTATKRLVEACAARGIKRFALVSTSAVYGPKPGILCTEEMKPEPLSLYAFTKLFAERDVMKLLPAAIFRLGTLHGKSPRMRYDLLVNEFVNRGKTKGEITVFGGEQRRPFVHVRDTAEMLAKGATTSVSGIFNLTSENLSVLQVAECAKKVTGCRLNIFADVKDKRDYALNSDKAKRELGFSPKWTVEASMREMVA